MKLIRTFSIYTVASFINKGVMFSIIPFLTNVISTEQNGILSLYGIFVMFIIPFILMGFSNSIMIEYSRLDEAEYRQFFSSSLALSTLSFILILLLFLSFGHLITFMVGAPYRLLLFGILYAYCNIYFEAILAYNRTIQKPFVYFWLSILKNLLEVSLIVWLVIGLRKGVEGKVVSSLVVVACVFLFALYYFNKNSLLTWNIKRKYINSEFRFGISQVFFQLNLFILASTDKFMINHILHNTAGLGVYFVANQFAFIINVIVTSFFLSYQPQLYTYLSNLTLENKYRLVKVKYLFAGFLLICTLGLCFLTPVFYHLFIKNLSYHGGISFVAWNAFAFFFWGLYALFLGYLYYFRKNRIVIIFSILSSVVCVSINYLFISHFGIIGAAYADLLTYIILFLAMVFTVLRVTKIDLPWFDFKGLFMNNKLNPKYT